MTLLLDLSLQTTSQSGPKIPTGGPITDTHIKEYLNNLSDNVGDLTPGLEESLNRLILHAIALEAGGGAPTGMFGDLTATSADAVISQLSHERSRVSNIQELLNLTFNPMISSVGGRLFALRGGQKGLSMQGLDVLVGEERLSLDKLANSLTDGGEEIPGISDKLGIFLNGKIGFGDKNQTRRERGFHFNTYKITGGIDYRFTDNLILGAAASYVHIQRSIDYFNGERPDADGVSFSLYGNYYIKDNFYVDAVASLGINKFDTSRKIIYTMPDGVGGIVSANQKMYTNNTDATMKSFTLGSGYDFNHKSFTFGPYGRMTYTRNDIDSYRERASAPGAPGSEWRLRVESQDVKSVTTAFGVQGSYPISTRWAVLSPQVRAEWMHEYSSKDRRINASFVEDYSGGSFVARTDEPDRDFINWAVGMSAVFPNGKTAFIDYERTTGLSDWSINNITFGFRWEL